MTRTLCHRASAADAGERLDTIMAAQGLYASRSAAARAIDDGRVLVNGQPVAKRYLVATGDTIVYEILENMPRAFLKGQPIDLDIRFEDDHLIVLSKQVGLVCHPSMDHYDDTLVNALIYHCGAGSLCNVQGDDDRLGIVHRLDRDTSGLMLAAKDDACGSALMEDIRARAVDRRYVSLVHGIIAHDTGMIDAPIARAEKERTRMAIRDTASARDAMTTFRVLERFEHSSRDEGYTLVDCKLSTGRTHQIRVHMEYAKHPLVGDPVYHAHAPRDASAALSLTRQFLHSFRLDFTHPETGEELSFADNLPSDLRRALSRLNDRSLGRTEAGDEVSTLMERAPIPRIEGEVPT